tara:strand:- start:124 stop:531 length:408 start_codon:yes stop_codon:yes gene_type:complete
MRKIQLGSVSTGTLRTEDLIDALSGEIKYLEIPNAQKILSEANEITDFDTENASFILEEMFEKLNEYAPPHMQFGSHDSDGANFGWWTTDFENCHTLSIDQGKFVDTECGLYVEVNDHGNMTVKELGGAVIWDCV